MLLLVTALALACVGGWPRSRGHDARLFCAAPARGAAANQRSAMSGRQVAAGQRRRGLLPEAAGVRIVREAAEAAERQQPVSRWRRRLRSAAAACVALCVTVGTSQSAWARAARKYVSRKEEQKAKLITCAVLALFFLGAYYNSRKEDSSEDARIKNEVERLVRLKKEYDAKDNDDEEVDDDSMAAALRKAQEKMQEEKEGKEGEEEAKEGDEKKEGDDGAAEEGSKDKPTDDDKPKPDTKEKPKK